jgi:hypothetical protein
MDEKQHNSEPNEELGAENIRDNTEIKSPPGISDVLLEKKLAKIRQLSGLKPYKKGVSGNPQGRPVGAKSYNTLFDKALRKVAQENKINLKDPEVQLLTRGLIEALKGNYSFYRDLLDRRFGRPKESVEVTGGSLPIVLEITRGIDRHNDNQKQQENQQQNLGEK